MNVLFLLNTSKDQNGFIGKKIIFSLLSNKFNVFVENNYYNINEVFLVDNYSIESIDLILVLGGDGTMLHYLGKYSHYNIPFLGINLGRVGVLTLLNLDNYCEYLSFLKEGKYKIEKNYCLFGKISHENKTLKEFIAYNDLVVCRDSFLKIIKYQVNFGEEDYFDIFSDGLIFSTPIGSSAYNLSAGGPLLKTDNQSFVLTPVCSQANLFPAIVYSNQNKVSLKIGNNIGNFKLICDGDQTYTFDSSCELEISKSDNSYCFVKFNDNNINRIMDKLLNTLKIEKGE